MTDHKKGSLTSRLARWRVWVQSAFLLAWLDPMAMRFHNVCSPVFHCHSCPWATFACPIGILAQFSSIHVFPFVALGTLVVVGAVLGTFLCGWACPFGFLQDLVGRIPTPKFQLPAWTGHLRYLVLVALVLVIPYLYGEEHPLFFCSLCPAGALEAAIPNTATSAVAGEELVLPSLAKTVILLLFLTAMLFTWRPWCTLFCPLGAIYALLSKVSVFFIRFRSQECNDCDLCRDLCRYRGRSERRGGDLRCIRCLDCTRCSAIGLTSIFGPSGKSSDGSLGAAEE